MPVTSDRSPLDWPHFNLITSSSKVMFWGARDWALTSEFDRGHS